MRIHHKRIDLAPPAAAPAPQTAPAASVYDEFMRAQANPVLPTSSYRTGASYQSYAAAALDKTLRDGRLARTKAPR